jgi:hypothetical protein
MPESGEINKIRSIPLMCLIGGNLFESRDILNTHKTKEHDFKIIRTE